MEVKNRVMPNREQIEGFAEPGPSGPIYMVNLLKFKEHAEYPDGRESDLSGEEAYGIYAAEVVEHLAKVGSGPIFSGAVSQLLLGEVEDLWDAVAIAMYPSRQKMLEMVTDPAYMESAVHRTAGLEGQLNIETTGAGALALQTGF